MIMNAVIFDIDGTLTKTSQVDADCFVKAIENVFSIKVDITDWSQYKNSTDSGITEEIFQKYFRRLPSPDELSTLKSDFVDLLKKSFNMNPKLFNVVPGVCTMLSNLQKNQQWAVGIASGCWKSSALLKLQSAGISSVGILAAFSEDAISREDIITTALVRIKNQYGLRDLEKIVYVGDGIWDARAARKLGIGFLGIQLETDNKRLQDEGVMDILPNFLDYLEFIRALERIGKRE